MVELGITPAVTTGILHLSAGTGQVGAGVAEAPLACFADALTDLDRRLSGQPRGPDPRPRWPSGALADRRSAASARCHATSIGGESAIVLDT